VVETSDEELERLIGGCVRSNIGPILKEKAEPFVFFALRYFQL
jgi:hypothetical protein